MSPRAGRHFLQIPGPSNVPDRILRAIDRPVIDHRGPEFAKLAAEVLQGLKSVFKTMSPIVIYPASGTGAWEAALVNTLSPGDQRADVRDRPFRHALAPDGRAAVAQVDFVAGDWRHGVPAARVEAKLAEDKRSSRSRRFAASTTRPRPASPRTSAAVRRAMDALGHHALLLVDTVSSLASMDYRHDEWGVDVTVAGSQKGLMLPPGLSFNAVSERALAASKSAALARSYWRWEDMLGPNRSGFFSYTPATDLLFGLQEALTMLLRGGSRQRLRASRAHADRHTTPPCAPGVSTSSARPGRVFQRADCRGHAGRPRRR